MQEVGGSIPPGSTTLRPLGFAWRSHVGCLKGEAWCQHSPQGEDGLHSNDSEPYVYVIRSINSPEQEYVKRHR